MPTRTVNIALVMQPASKAVTIRFVPDLASLGDDTLLLAQEYTVTTAADGTGSIELPVKATGSILYTYYLPRDGGGYSTGSFAIADGAAVNLEDLIAAGGLATDSLQEYFDQQIALLAVDADVVHKTGAEAVAGVKTFSSSPIVPTPTTDFQAATKKYVDDSKQTVGDLALRFDSALGQHVNHGYFWQRDVAHGNFFWEAWVNAETGAEYFISDGYGGAHNLLLGLSGGNPCSLAGNIYSSGTISFGSNDTFAVGEWHHVAVSWNGTYIITYIDGVPSKLTAFSGVRQTNTGAADGVLFIAGSTHSNYKGMIRMVRGFEGFVPLSSAYSQFRPEHNFRAAIAEPGGNDVKWASFVADYTRPGHTIPDLSVGHLGTPHPGVLREGNDLDTGGFDSYYAAPGDLPTWRAANFIAPVYTGGVTATPGGAIFFDAFERDNKTYAWSNTLGLGTSPTGHAWTNPYGASPWGIIGTYAYQGANSSAQIELVDLNQNDYDFRMTRKATDGGYPSVIVRFTDTNNFVRVDTASSGYIAIQEYVAGVLNVLESLTTDIGTSWQTLRVVVNGTNLKVYVDASGTEATSVTMNAALTTGDKAGISTQVPTDRIKSVVAY